MWEREMLQRGIVECYKEMASFATCYLDEDFFHPLVSFSLSLGKEVMGDGVGGLVCCLMGIWVYK